MVQQRHEQKPRALSMLATWPGSELQPELELEPQLLQLEPEPQLELELGLKPQLELELGHASAFLLASPK